MDLVNIVSVDDDKVHFTLNESGSYNFQVIFRGNVMYEVNLDIDKKFQYFISHSSIQNYGSFLRVNGESVKIHDSPIINIITRVSRLNLFEDCYKSVKNQTYKNINHILTYETEFIGDKIKLNYDLENVSLCKVSKLKKLDGLYRSFTYNQFFRYEELDQWDYKVWDGVEETSNRADKGKTRMKSEHFPFESYLKMAEKRIKYGWVMYLDDDDILINDNVIEEVAERITKFDVDTIHWMQCYDPSKSDEVHQTDNGLFPRKYVLDHLDKGTPPSLHSINSSCFIFHSKYIEYTAWDQWYGDDYRTALSLSERIPKRNIIPIPVVSLVNGYGHGK